MKASPWLYNTTTSGVFLEENYYSFQLFGFEDEVQWHTNLNRTNLNKKFVIIRRPEEGNS